MGSEVAIPVSRSQTSTPLPSPANKVRLSGPKVSTEMLRRWFPLSRMRIAASTDACSDFDSVAVNSVIGRARGKQAPPPVLPQDILVLGVRHVLRSLPVLSVPEPPQLLQVTL